MNTTQDLQKLLAERDKTIRSLTKTIETLSKTIEQLLSEGEETESAAPQYLNSRK